MYGRHLAPEDLRTVDTRVTARWDDVEACRVLLARLKSWHALDVAAILGLVPGPTGESTRVRLTRLGAHPIPGGWWGYTCVVCGVVKKISVNSWSGCTTCRDCKRRKVAV